MDEHMGKRVVHRYDTATRRVLCGITQQTSSTKHASGVTCPTCRALLDGPASGATRFDAATDAQGA